MNKEEEDNLCTFCTFHGLSFFEEEKKKNMPRFLLNLACPRVPSRVFQTMARVEREHGERAFREMNWPTAEGEKSESETDASMLRRMSSY